MKCVLVTVKGERGQKKGFGRDGQGYLDGSRRPSERVARKEGAGGHRGGGAATGKRVWPRLRPVCSKGSPADE